MSKSTIRIKTINRVHYWWLLGLLLTACNAGAIDQAVQQTVTAQNAAIQQAAQEESEASIQPSPTFTPIATSTATPMPPSATATAIPPTSTATTIPPTSTATPVPHTPTPTPLPPSPELSLLLDPNFGSTSLSDGFLPDPDIISMTSGGDIDVSYLNNGCAGYATAAPDFRLFWSGNGAELNFMFIPEFSGEDTTLIINAPNESWHCNDDFDGVNPGIRFGTALSGQYDIWVGSFSPDENISGQLHITELAIPPQPTPPIDSELNPGLDPNFGSKSLSVEFLPDPDLINMTSGGDVNVSYLNNGCTGYATAAPDFRLFWSGEGAELNFLFIPDFSGDDTTLIINDPNGNWHCNDDFDSVNPGIRFGIALSGQYDIWVGSFSPDENISGQLHITEFTIP